MNLSSDSSQEGPDQRLLLPLGPENNAEQLFDKLINNDNENNKNNEDQDEMNVQRPTKTYQRTKWIKEPKPKILLHLCDECSETLDLEDEDLDDDDEYEDPLFENEKPEEENKQKKKKTGQQGTRRRRLALPNVSKDAVLEAFSKAIESHELPNFEEIEKFPLTIVKDDSVQDDQPKESKSSRKSTRTTATRKKSITTTKTDKENVVAETGNNRRGRSTRRVLGEKSVNQQQPQQESVPTTPKVTQRKKRLVLSPIRSDSEDTSPVGLFDLNESCIPKSIPATPFSPPPARRTRRSARIQRSSTNATSTPYPLGKNKPPKLTTTIIPATEDQ